MYINAKQRTNAKDVKVFYLYVCESQRVEGKVVNKQRYFGSIKETDLIENDFSQLDKAFEDEKWTQEDLDKINVKLEDIISAL